MPKAASIVGTRKGLDMDRIMVAVTVAGLLAGCTSDPGFRGVPGIREATAAEVVSFRYIVNISGKPSVYGPVLGPEGLKYTRNRILADARDAGANTVVFDQVTPGAEVYELHATAYAC